MCGRTCLTLDANEVVTASRYKRKRSSNFKDNNNCNNNISPKKCENSDDDVYVVPEWRSEFNCGRKYTPSYNMAPRDITPVLVSTAHFSNEDHTGPDDGRLVVPMMWGMIPFWHKGDYRKHGLTTNNCRLEHMLDSKLYGGPFRRGQRCVVVCEGFYEWQTTKSAKPSERAAYFIYEPQADQVKIYDKSTWSPEQINLVKMAGLFDVWEDEHGDKIYSYSVITFESSKGMSWLHHRMPAVLETDQQINDWLDFKNMTDEQALAALRPATQLQWHRVSNMVNNSRNKSDQCNKPLELVQSQKPVMNKLMSSWLNVRKRREAVIKIKDSDDDDELENQSGMGTTSESETENPAKRPRFRDYKRNAQAIGSSSSGHHSAGDGGSHDEQSQKPDEKNL